MKTYHRHLPFVSWIVIVTLIAALIVMPAVRAAQGVEFTRSADPAATTLPTSSATLAPAPTSIPLERDPFPPGTIGVVLTDFNVLDPATRRYDKEVEVELQDEGIFSIHVHQVISDRAEARQLARQYNATLVVWGSVDRAGLTVNFEINPPPMNDETKITVSGLQANIIRLDNFSTVFLKGMDYVYIDVLIKGLVTYFRGDMDYAIENLHFAIERIPSGQEKQVHAEALYFYQGAAYFAQRDDNVALDNYTQVLQLSPNDAPVHNNRGVLFAAEQDYARALDEYNQAIQLDPSYAPAFYNRGNIYFERNDPALSLPPNSGSSAKTVERSSYKYIA